MAEPDTPKSPYLVLARKYRPQSFETLIGQDAMVRTLTNAFASGRVHHAFMLTGVRGVGKTTTARILARAFNYADENGPRMTLDFAREGLHDRAIIEGRHLDVIEMDAASNTSINDIREIIDSVKYGPVSAPYKIYIIDEVHMLSDSAFNGLLKTLEEPPPYVKFIFATTDIGDVPVTVLSRCMRFDLRRVPADVMTPHLAGILEKEGIGFEPEALQMIVRAGDGSVRDNLSLLDQAISYGGGSITADTVKAMLGLSDRAQVIDLFEHLMAGRIAEALGTFRDMYNIGADPKELIIELAELTHLVTRLKVVPGAADDPALTLEESRRGSEFARALGMRVLTRAWQILLKGHAEVSAAPNAMQAAEMVLVRLAFAAELPTPDELLTRVQATPAGSAPPVPRTPVPQASGGGAGASAVAEARMIAQPQVSPQVSQPQPTAFASPRSYADIIALASEKRDMLVKYALEAHLRPVSIGDGRLEVALVEGADPTIIQTLSARLKAWTGRTWMIMLARDAVNVPTIREQRQERHDTARAEAHQDPLVQAILDTFPGATVSVTLREEQIPVEAYADAIRDADEDDE